jgi:phosphatidylserine decarboxylase
MTQPQTTQTASRPPNVEKRLPIQPLHSDIRSIQPGGGVCIRIELAWGTLRRWYLKTFRPAYVVRMRGTRRGEPHGCPHEVLDPRDLKYHRNQTECHWDEKDDPFAWRDRLPFARVGLAELILLSGTCLTLAVIIGLVFWPAALVALGLPLFVAWFFRNPSRDIPQDPGLVVSPADGKVVAVEEVAHDEFIGGPAVVIGIFLSVFNVHINRVPVAGRIIGLQYRKGKFLNALRAASARENEQMIIQLEEDGIPHRRIIVRQIAGAIARRIVCWVAPGERLDRGSQFGMIKLGSRTELVLPQEEGLSVLVSVGDRVRAGSSVVVKYPSNTNHHE